jgi:hypothetical protein
LGQAPAPPSKEKTQPQKHMVEIEGDGLRPVTWVLVEEVDAGDWGIAGNGRTAAAGHAPRAQPAAAG